MADTELEKLKPPGPPDASDAHNPPIAGDARAKAMGEVGVSGLKVFSGYTNEEYLPELNGPKAPKMYRTMADDSIVNAMVTAITLILRAVDWRVEPAEPKEGKETSPEAEKEAEFGQSLLDDMSHSWEDFISEAMSMLIYGWSYHEIVLKRRTGPDETDPSKRSKFTDGRIGIRKLPIRSQDSLLKWEMQADGGVAGMWQQPPQGGEQLLIPIERALLLRTTSRKNSPEGVSILRAAYRPWFIRRGIEDHEAIGVERELAGLPVVSIPQKYLAANATAEEKAFALTAQTIARDLKYNHQGGVVIPSETFQDNDGAWSTVKKMSIELLNTGGRRAIETGPIVQRYNRDIARSALADFLTLGDEKGSYALSKNKSDLFLRACETYLNQIAAVVNRFLFPRIFAYNGIAHELIPVLKPGRVSPVDLPELGAYIQALAGAGAPLFPNQDLSNYLADVAGLPEPPEDIGLMAAPGAAPGPGQIDPNTGKPIQPKIDPKSGRPMHEVEQEQTVNDLAAQRFQTSGDTPAKKFNHNHDSKGRFDQGRSLEAAMARVRREMKGRSPDTVVVKKPSGGVLKWLKSPDAKNMLTRGLIAGGIGIGLHTLGDFAAAQAAEVIGHHLVHVGEGLTHGLTLSGLSVMIQQGAEHIGVSPEHFREHILHGIDKMLGTRLGKAIDDITIDDPEVQAFLRELYDAIAGMSDAELAGVEKRGSGAFPFDKAGGNPNHDERGRFATSPSGKKVELTQEGLERLDIDDLDQMAFGHKTGDVLDLKPSQVKIQYHGDLVNPQDKFDREGMKWAHSVDLSEPVKVEIHTDGKMYLADGHHRWFAAGKTGRSLKAEINIQGKPITAILARGIHKYNHNHDDHGRFDFATISFVSPNVSNTDLTQAQRDLLSNRQIQLQRASNDIDNNLGLHTSSQNAIGVWEDGAESSMMFSSTGGDFNTVKTAAAMKGSLANQKSVLVFQPGHGDDFMANFHAKGNVDDISHSLLKDGLAFHTLVPTGDGAKVYVYGSGQSELNNAGRAASARGQQLDVVSGRGEFVGTTKHDGSDAEQRADARHVYSQVIDAGLGAGHGGSNGRAHWEDIQRRWGSALKRLIEKYNPYHDERGRFTFGTGVKATGIAASTKTKKQWIDQSHIETVDQLYAGSPSNKEAVDIVGTDTAQGLNHGLQYKAPGIKGRARVLEKIAAGRKPAGVTDVVRATFVAPTPQQADEAVEHLSKYFPITDEGYKKTDAGYIDRAVNVHFPNGQIGEVLVMNPEMAYAKSPDGGGGHDLYAASRALPNGDPEKARLESAQRHLYGGAYNASSPAWKAAMGG